MCEPLRGKLKTYTLRTINEELEFFRLSDVKFAVEFYKKYRGDIIDKSENGWEKKEKLQDKYYSLRTKNPMKYMGSSYNDWLFDYCFGDVIE